MPTLRIMLVDDQTGRSEMIAEALSALGHRVVSRVPSDALHADAVVQCRPDVIVVDMDAPSRDVLDGMTGVSRDCPRPIVMFTNDDDGETIRRAVHAGVSAYVVEGLQRVRVQPILEAAIARFDAWQGLREELATTRRNLEERKTIEQAKGLLMRQAGIGEAEAYDRMRRQAMDRNIRVADVARSVLAAAELLQ